MTITIPSLSNKMRPDAGFTIPCLFLLVCICLPNFIGASPSPSSGSCHPDQRHALLRFIQPFSIPDPKLASWREEENCCCWEGVTCDNSTGDVIGLDLTFAGLRGFIGSSSSLFSLHHLRRLSLHGNDFQFSPIPPEIGMFTRLEYLDLSSSGISGILPIEISHLSKLFYLNLSNNIDMGVQDHIFKMLVGNLTRIEELDLESVDMFTVAHTSFTNLSSSLIALKLSSCSMGGKFPEFIFGLPNLQIIDISLNRDLTGTLPVSNLSPRLSYLSLNGCLFTGTVPNSIGNLSRLTHLDLSNNNFTGKFELGTLSTLEDLRFLNLFGISVSGKDANHGFSLPKLQELYMKSCNLSKFPSFLSRSKELRMLDLSENRIQEIPSWFWSIGIDTLEELYLDDNIIRGSIPPSICRLTSLYSIALNSNNLTGVIPRCLGNLTKLHELYLNDNSLSGPLPPSLANCTSLKYFHAEDNILEGPLPMPPAFIRDFYVENNRITRSIPLSMCRLSSLFCLELSGNYLTGVIPQCMGNLTNLRWLDLGNNSLSGTLPPSLANCTSLGILDVSYNSISGAPSTWLSTTSIPDINLRANNFDGRWPPDTFLWSASIDLSDNQFKGPLPVPHFRTQYYLVSNNHFSGQMPSAICNATYLQILDFSNNSITGVLPDCLKNVTSGLSYLNLRANEFHGQIPEIFHEGSMLTSLDLSRNHFEGSLLRSLSNCTNLEALDVGSNKITDYFPNWLGDLPLKVLSLRSNNFHGQVIISNETHSFSQVRIMDLSNNNFRGNITDKFIGELLGMTPYDIYDFPHYYMVSSEYYSVMIDLKGVETEMVKINVRFSMLDLSGNHFHGEISESIGLLKSLKGLNFSHNRFTGTIPPSVGDLTYLESLDLSCNHLMGEIPKDLVKLASLGYLDLSWNNLTGPIPPGGHFNTFLNSSFQGNPGLCGIPLTRSCDQGNKEVRPPSHGKESGEEDGGGWLEWEYVALGFGSGMGIGISLGYMALEMGWPLWLVRMVIQLETGFRKRWKRKGAPRRNG